MNIYDASKMPGVVAIGYDGENNWRPQSFDCASLLENHPNGTLTLWILPHSEEQAYPVALSRAGNIITWTPLSEELTGRGGALQIVCTDGTDVGKSAIALYRVSESVIPGADHPASVPSWATQTVERAEAAADRAEEAADSIDLEHLEQTISEAVEDYMDEHPITAPVQSVNGKTGAVVLDAEDVGALPDDTVIPVVPQMATQINTSDWTSGKTVDAETLKEVVFSIDDDVSSKPDAVDLANVAFSGDYRELNNKPTIPTVDSALSSTSENPVQNKVVKAALDGKGTYSKPSGGIPKTDLASDVQTSLGKADTALQSHQSLAAYQTKAITDTGGYYTTDTVEGALQEIGAELAGVNTLIGSGVIT